MTPNSLQTVSDAELLDSTRALVLRSNTIEADLLAHLTEVEDRKLHLERAFPSMFEYCMEELGMSEGVAANRIYVARLVRRLPLVLEWVRASRIHLSGLRVLAPHLTDTNCAALLAEAAGKSKRDIELLVTRYAPKPPVPTTIRMVPARSVTGPVAHRVQFEPAPTELSTSVPFATALTPTAPPPRPKIEPLTPVTFKLTLTIDEALREKVKQAQELMHHRFGHGDLAALIEEALDLLIDKVKKERFGVGRTPRATKPDPVPGEGAEGSPHVSRHIPDAIKRTVYERDGRRCTFVSTEGRRCSETRGLELDHLDGFAITREHSAERIFLRCRPHNEHAAEKMFGREKMARMKKSLSATCPGACEQELLF